VIVTVDSRTDADEVRRDLMGRGLWVKTFFDLGPAGRVHFLVEPGSSTVSAAELLAVPGVIAVAAQDSPHPLVDAQPAVVDVGGIRIGGAPDADPVIMAGPCSVESREQIHTIAAALQPIGVRFLRGAAYKSRTSPYAFQGHGAQALDWLREAADENGMSVVTEALNEAQLERVAEIADLLQIGSRNMHNTPLLRAAGATRKPVLLKRGMAATVEEWLQAGEYCLLHGASAVVFCERGLRGFDPSTRNNLDLGAAALLARVHRLPVIVDPSHATGRRDLIPALCRAALASGASGVMLETHHDPARALSDGPQAVPVGEMAAIVAEIHRLSGRSSCFAHP